MHRKDKARFVTFLITKVKECGSSLARFPNEKDINDKDENDNRFFQLPDEEDKKAFTSRSSSTFSSSSSPRTLSLSPSFHLRSTLSIRLEETSGSIFATPAKTI